MLTHVNRDNKAEMVDVSLKKNTLRKAIAACEIEFPEEMITYFDGKDFQMKKGPVFQTAIIAATQAVKKTYDIIPFCHQIPLDAIKIYFEEKSYLKYQIYCLVKTDYKTGVEMEALMGVSVAALTVIDMCKAVSSEIKINQTELLYKVGGKKIINKLPTYGLVLTGGKSQRMNQDKALISYHGEAHAKYLYKLMKNECHQVFLSAKNNQWQDSELNKLPQIYDEQEFSGPIIGIISAMKKYPFANWIVMACDLAFVDSESIKQLKDQFDSSKLATAYRNPDKGFAEALCAIYSPDALDVFQNHFEQQIYCPVKILKNTDVKLIDSTNIKSVMNINTPQERMQALNEIH